jgi:hypothetical protein
MAEKLNAKEGGGRKLHPQDIVRAITEVARHKENGREYNGMAGNATKEACERLGLDKKAFTFVENLHRKGDTVKALTVLTDTIIIAAHLKLFDQLDMFSDAIPLLEEIVEKAKAGRSAAPSGGGSVLSGLVN